MMIEIGAADGLRAPGWPKSPLGAGVQLVTTPSSVLADDGVAEDSTMDARWASAPRPVSAPHDGGDMMLITAIVPRNALQEQQRLVARAVGGTDRGPRRVPPIASPDRIAIAAAVSRDRSTPCQGGSRGNVSADR